MIGGKLTYVGTKGIFSPKVLFAMPGGHLAVGQFLL